MRWIQILFLWLRALLFRGRVEQELAEELRLHTEEQIAANIRAGMSAAEARRTALVGFGGVEQIKEECRDARGVSWLENLLRDVRFGFRMLRKSPAYTSAAILTLVLGIGANTAIFSVVNAVLLRPLPFLQPSRLVELAETRHHAHDISISYLDFRDWQQQSHTLRQIAAFRSDSFNLTGSGEPERLPAKLVSANFLATLGVQPFLGRDFTADEDQPGGRLVVLLTYPLWRDRFSGDPSLVGKSLVLDGHSYTVIGILPAGLNLPVSGSVFTTMGPAAKTFGDRSSHPGIYALGRLRDAATLEQARAEMATIAGRLEQTYPDSNVGIGVSVVSLREELVQDLRTSLLVLMGAVGFVLLIACFNVANLQLSRAASREREFTVRRVIGASRGRIISQLLTESLLLALLGAGLGIVLARWLMQILVRLLPPDVSRLTRVDLDARVLLFTLLVAVLVGILFGLLPALQASRARLQESLREGGRTATSGARRRRFRQFLVISEVALALVLLLGAGLMLRSLHNLSRVNPGFDTQHVLTMKISLPDSRYPTPLSAQNFFRQLIGRVSNLPGAQGAAVVIPLPLSGDGWQEGFYVEGEPIPAHGHLHVADFHLVSPGYFPAIGIPLLRGRDFSSSDDAATPPVAIISEQMARTYWPGADAVGKRFFVGHPNEGGKWMTVLGVAGDTRHYGLDAPARSEFYLSYLQHSADTMVLVVRTSLAPLGLVEQVKTAVHEQDAVQPVFDVSTMDQLLADSLAARQTAVLLLGVFAAMALLLASVGIYGVTSYSVAERTHEVGVRMALGAQPRQVFRLLMGQGIILAAAGLILGLAAALAITPVLKSMLFGVSPLDAATFALVPLLLGVVALIACYLPTRRAMRVDPMTALRYE